MARKKLKNLDTVDLDQAALLEALQNDLKKIDKNDEFSHVSDDIYDDSACGVTEWVSTGCSTLDLAVSNRPNGGLPVGKIVEFYGLEGSGKSAFSAYIIKNTYKMGGVSYYIDTESALNSEFWESLGVKSNYYTKSSITTVEDIFSAIEACIVSYRRSSKDKILTIIVDSVSAASTKQEMESKYDKDGYNTAKALIVSKALRKITNLISKQKVLLVFNNQVRFNMNAAKYADPYIVPGGKAIAFHSSVRIQLKNVKKIKKDDLVIGSLLKATVVKNRLGPPYRSAEIEFYYNGGITDHLSWIKVMKDHKIATAAGAYVKYKRDNGETIQFMAKEFLDILNNDSELKDEIYKKICDASILVYSNLSSDMMGDIEEDSEDSDDIIDEELDTE